MKKLVLSLLLLAPMFGVAGVQTLDPLPDCLPCRPGSGGGDNLIPATLKVEVEQNLDPLPDCLPCRPGSGGGDK